MTTAHLYLRVSTGKQADSGLGIEAQEAACRAWCEANGYTVGGVYSDEGVSGGKSMDERPGLMDAVNAVCQGEALVVYDRSRMGRDQIECAIVDRIVDRKGGCTRSANGIANGDGPTDQLLRTILDAVSQWERANSALKTRLAMRAKKARGEYTGGRVLLGYRLAEDGRTLEEDPAEQDAIRLMICRRREGWSFGRIAAELNEDPEDYPTRSGKGWNRSTIARVCTEEGL